MNWDYFVQMLAGILVGTALGRTWAHARVTRKIAERIEKANAAHIQLIAKMVGYTVPGQRK